MKYIGNIKKILTLTNSNIETAKDKEREVNLQRAKGKVGKTETVIQKKKVRGNKAGVHAEIRNTSGVQPYNGTDEK